MKVKLVSITKPLVKVEREGKEVELSPEELLVWMARVSSPSNQDNIETSDKLINFLIKHGHWSPLDMIDMAVEFYTSRAIAQQFIRHFSIKIQEFSQRYSEVTEFEPIQLRKQADKNRQSSLEEFDPKITVSEAEWPNKSFGVETVSSASILIQKHLEDSKVLYEKLIKAGVAKECARMVLPLTTQTRLFAKASCRSWVTYLNQRLDVNSQLEHRQLALGIAEIFTKEFPMISKALNNFNDLKGSFL